MGVDDEIVVRGDDNTKGEVPFTPFDVIDEVVVVNVINVVVVIVPATTEVGEFASPLKRERRLN